MTFYQFLCYLDKMFQIKLTFQIVIDDERFASDPASTPEVLACLTDIKVLGKKSLRDVLAWRRKIKKNIVMHDEQPGDTPVVQGEGEADATQAVDEFVIIFFNFHYLKF